MLGKIRTKPVEDADLNLTPIMNLFVAMIPMLLMSASFFQLSVVNASVPTVADDSTVIELEKKKVTMTLHLKEDQMKLSGGNEYLSNEEMDALSVTLIKNRKGYPYSKLTAFLANIKKQFPESDTLVLVPEKTIDYQTIIRTMDASRSIKSGKSGDKEAELFPAVVVSSLVE